MPHGADRHGEVELDYPLLDYFGFDFLCSGCKLQETIKTCAYFGRCVRSNSTQRFRVCQSMCVYATTCANTIKHCEALDKSIIILKEVHLDDL